MTWDLKESCCESKWEREREKVWWQGEDEREDRVLLGCFVRKRVVLVQLRKEPIFEISDHSGLDTGGQQQQN